MNSAGDQMESKPPAPAAEVPPDFPQPMEPDKPSVPGVAPTVPSPRMITRAKRLVKIVFGFTLLAVGGALLVLPGPGIPVVIAGLAVLAAEYVWARRLLKRIARGATRLKDAALWRRGGGARRGKDDDAKA